METRSASWSLFGSRSASSLRHPRFARATCTGRVDPALAGWSGDQCSAPRAKPSLAVWIVDSSGDPNDRGSALDLCVVATGPAGDSVFQHSGRWPTAHGSNPRRSLPSRPFAFPSFPRQHAGGQAAHQADQRCGCLS